MSATIEPVVTRVARCGFKDMRFLGWSVFDDLMGKESFLSLVALGLMGRRLEAAEVALLDDLAVVLTAADPRIWVPKASRLLASHGDHMAGTLGGQLCVLGANVGPETTIEAAKLLHDVREAVGNEQDPTRMRDRIAVAIDTRQRLGGFGVPYREVDIRYQAMMERTAIHGFRDRSHCRLVSPLVDVVSAARRGLAPNISLVGAAICLDLGLTSKQIGAFLTCMCFPSIVANTFEESELRSPALRELPVDSIDYVGQAPRRSPRAGISPSPGDGE